nr:MAG TPA: cell division protein [Crassvirales sp.]
MNRFWKLATCALLAYSVSMTIGSNNLSNQIEELQSTVDRQANAITKLEKEKNNVEVNIPQYLDSLPGGD